MLAFLQWPAEYRGRPCGAFIGDGMVPLEYLRHIAAWSHELPESEAERARKGIIEKTYAKGSYICHLGDTFDCWTGIVSGLVKLSTVSETGRQVTLAGLPTSAWFGEGSILKQEPRRYDVIALRETRLALMDSATFFWLFEHSVAFNRFLVRQLNERIGHFMAQLENDRTLDASGRIARTLAAMFHPVLIPGVGAHLEITQEEVGLLSGLSRQIANQSLKKLEADGVLQLERGGLRVRNRADLLNYGASRKG